MITKVLFYAYDTILILAGPAVFVLILIQVCFKMVKLLSIVHDDFPPEPNHPGLVERFSDWIAIRYYAARSLARNRRGMSRK